MSPSWWQRWFAPKATRSDRRPGRPPRPHRPRLEVLEDRCVPTVFTVNTTLDLVGHPLDAHGVPQESLRQAIIDADSSSGSDVIKFAIAPGGHQTLNVGDQAAGLYALPPITEGVTIDGTTQPGYAGTPVIELNGSGAGPNASGLMIQAPNSLIRGLVINNFGSSGVWIYGSSATNNLIVGNYIGTDVTGTTAQPNGYAGVLLDGAPNNTVGPTALWGPGNVISGNTYEGVVIHGGSGDVVEGNLLGTDAGGTAPLGNGDAGVYVYGAANNVTVGGTTSAARNVISGNATEGVTIFGTGSGTHEVSVLGNYIGTDSSGAKALANGDNGVLVQNAYMNRIGGTAAGAGNVISGNTHSGVAIFGGYSFQNIIQGNLVGTDAGRTKALGNGTFGVFVADAAGSNTTGGTVAAAGNVIAFNADDGVLIGSNPVAGATVGTMPAAINNAVLSNSIFSNGGLGIDLGPHDGVTPNDAGDFDTGPNNLQNFPVITSVTTSGGLTTVHGTLDTGTSTGYRVEFFVSAAGNPSGFGEGQTIIAWETVSTDVNGHANFSATFPLPPGKSIITTTATSPAGNTSEFSRWNATATALTSSVNPSATNQPVTFTATVTAVEPGAGVPTGTVTFLDGTTTLDTENLDAVGQATFTTSTLSVGSHNITAVYSGNLAGSTSPAVTQTVNAYGSSDHLVFTAQPTATTAGQVIDSPGGVQVAVEDAFGNLVANDSSTVSVTLSSATFADGTTSAGAQASGGVATFSNLVIDTAGTHTLQAADGSLGAATSASFQVTADAASKLAFTGQPSDVTAGQAVSPAVTVAVEDQFGNLETGDSSSVTLTLSSGTFADGSGTASVQASGGVATFSGLVIDAAGTYTLTATDASLTPDTSAPFTVKPDVPNHLTFTQQPSDVTAGQAVSRAATVAVEDQFGNLETTDSSTVTLTLSSGTFAGGSATATAQASGGVASFGGLTIDTAGGYTLTASDAVLSPATSVPFSVRPDVANNLAFGQQPSDTTAGQAVSPAVAVAVEDQFGNLETADTSTVTLKLGVGIFADGSATESARAAGGVASFGSLVIDAAGTYTLLATDGSLSSATSASFTVLAAAADHFSLTAPAGSTAGSPFSVTVTARDPYNNIATDYTGTVSFTSSDGRASLPGDYPFTAADAGAHTFQSGVTLKTAGSQTVTASDKVAGSITGSSAVTVSPAAASTMTVGGFPSPTTAGVAGNFTVTLLDPYGNIARGYTGTVHFTSSDGKASLPANYPFTAADAGVHTFSATLKTAGTQALTVTDTTTASLTGTDRGITVNPGAAKQFLLSAPSSVRPGASFSLTLTVEDAYGNVVTGYTGTVHFSSTDNKATLPSNYTFTAADKGVHTFTGLVLRKKQKQKITITDTLNSALTSSVIVDVR